MSDDQWDALCMYHGCMHDGLYKDEALAAVALVFPEQITWLVQWIKDVA